MHRALRPIWPILCCALAGALGCASAPPEAAEAPDASEARPHPWVALGELVDLDGAPLAAHLAETERPVVVAAFATWCGPCRAELALLRMLHDERPDVRFVALNAHETWGDLGDDESLAAFAARELAWLPVARADDRFAESVGGIPRIPALWVFRADGELVETWRNVNRPPPDLPALRAALAAADARDETVRVP